MNKWKILVLAFFSLASLFVLSSKASAADLFKGACTGAAANSSVCQQGESQGSNNPVAGPGGLISKAANIIAVVGGIIAVIMIIVSGFMFVTSAGVAGGQRATDPSRVKTAKATLAGALVGLVIIALAWTITRFVTDTIIK